MWQVVFTRQAQKDAKKLSAAGLCTKTEHLIEILRENPYMTPPPFEKLLGDLSGERKYDKFYYDADAFLPLLKYDHVNKTGLYGTRQSKFLRHAGLDPASRKTNFLNPPGYRLPVKTLDRLRRNDIKRICQMKSLTSDYKKIYLDLGPGLILWLKLGIEQQYHRRKVQVKNPALAEWLNTSGTQVIKYKYLLKELAFLNIDTSRKIRKLSVNFFPD